MPFSARISERNQLLFQVHPGPEPAVCSHQLQRNGAHVETALIHLSGGIAGAPVYANRRMFWTNLALC